MAAHSIQSWEKSWRHYLLYERIQHRIRNLRRQRRSAAHRRHLPGLRQRGHLRLDVRQAEGRAEVHLPRRPGADVPLAGGQPDRHGARPGARRHAALEIPRHAVRKRDRSRRGDHRVRALPRPHRQRDRGQDHAPCGVKKPLILWLLAGCGLFGVIAAAVLFTLVKGWERDTAARRATDPSVENMGDDAHAVLITPEAALSIGGSAMVDGLRVTVTGAGKGRDRQERFLPSTDNMYFELKYTVENTSAMDRYPNPPVDS